MYDDNTDGVPDDQEWVDILTAAGYLVDYTAGASPGDGYWRTLDDDKIAALNAADLVIVSRNTNSGDYDDGEAPTQWNSITTPIILSSTYIARSSRWGWVDSTSIINIAPTVMEFPDGLVVTGINETVGPSSFIEAVPDNGVVLATGDGLPFIIEWEAGVEYYSGSGQTSGGPRMFFVAGTQEDAAIGIGRGEMNLTPEALGVFLDAVDILIPDISDITVRGNIAWVSYHAADDEPHPDAAAVGFTIAPDIGYTNLLKANGYDVTRVLTSQTPDVDYLNTMDLVIISRTASSGHYSGSGATLWNSVTAPMINLNGYTLRSSRLGFTDGTDMPDTTGDVRLAVTDPTHPIFAGIALTDDVMDNLYAAGAIPLPTDGTPSRGISINNNTPDNDGTVLATIAEVSADTGPVGGMVIAEWPAGAIMEHSSGSPTDVLGGPRLVFLTGSREPSGVTGGQAAALYDLYPDGEQMFLNAVKYYIPDKMLDITAPGDIVKGVPDDGDWPGAETPPNAFDNNVNTKYLHFKGDFDPDPGTGGAGIRITPLDGPSVVTGLSFTTANDVPGRDPIAFRLSGSNDGIDGPYELIAEGQIVDFDQPTEWPRFTKNTTPIMFANDKSYTNYELIFTAIRGPLGGSVNSMQIAEVELLGITVGREVGLVDDFENYNVFDRRIFDTWSDGTINPVYGGSVLSPTTEHIISQDGFDSAKVLINNTILPYSEIQIFNVPRDWTVSGADVLSVYVRGDSQNTDDASPIYVRIEDYVLYYYGQFSFNTEDLTELIFPLEEFAAIGVNLTDVSEMAIGIGIHSNTLINHVSIEPLQFNPQGIRPLQVNTCDYPSFNGVVYFDEIKLKRIGDILVNRCVLTGCVFVGNAPVGGATVSLSPNAGIGDPLTAVTYNEGRYLMFPVIAGYNVIVTKDGNTIYSGSLTNLQKGFNEASFP